MTAVMVPATSGSGGGNVLAWNNRGRQTITPNNTVTIVSFTAGAHRLRGFSVMGDENAFCWIEVDGVPLDGLAAVHSQIKQAYIALPNAETYASAASIVALRVQNTGDTSAAFEGVVFGE
jgi:hypothetical protein